MLPLSQKKGPGKWSKGPGKVLEFPSPRLLGTMLIETRVIYIHIYIHNEKAIVTLKKTLFNASSPSTAYLRW